MEYHNTMNWCESQSPKMTSTPQLRRNLKSIRASFDGVSPILPNIKPQRNVKSMIPVIAPSDKRMTTKLSLRASTMCPEATKTALNNKTNAKNNENANTNRNSKLMVPNRPNYLRGTPTNGPPPPNGDIRPSLATGIDFENDSHIFKTPSVSATAPLVWNQPPQNKKNLSLKRKSTLGKLKVMKTDIPPPTSAKDESIFGEKNDWLDEENGLSPFDISIHQVGRKTFVIKNKHNNKSMENVADVNFLDVNEENNVISKPKNEKVQNDMNEYNITAKIRSVCNLETDLDLSNESNKQDPEILSVSRKRQPPKQFWKNIDDEQNEPVPKGAEKLKVVSEENGDGPVPKRARKSKVLSQEKEDEPVPKGAGKLKVVSEENGDEPVPKGAEKLKVVSEENGDDPVPKRARKSKVLSQEKEGILLVPRKRQPPKQFWKIIDDEKNDPVPKRARKSKVLSQEKEDESVSKRSRKPKVLSQKIEDEPVPKRAAKPKVKSQEDEDDSVSKRARKPKDLPQENEDEAVSKTARNPKVLSQEIEDESVSKRSRKQKVLSQKIEVEPVPKRAAKPKVKPQEDEDEPVPKRVKNPKVLSQEDEDDSVSKRARKPKELPQENEDIVDEAVPKRVRKSKVMSQKCKAEGSVTNRGKRGKVEPQEINQKDDAGSKSVIKSKAVPKEDKDVETKKRCSADRESKNTVGSSSSVIPHEDVDGCFGLQKSESTIKNGISTKKMIHVPNYLMSGSMKLKPGAAIVSATTTTVYFVLKGVAQVKIKDLTKTITAECANNSFYVPKCCDFTIKNEESSVLKLFFTKFKD